MASKGKNGFSLDEDRLREVMRTVWGAYQRNQGIFKNGMKCFLPQWNLPKELEFSPQRKETADPQNAARFLYVRNFMDRMSDSEVLHRLNLRAWYDDKVNWIFNSKEVVKREVKEIENVLRYDFSYAIRINPKMSAGQGFLNNALKISSEFDNDPRNLVRYKKVEQARQVLQGLNGFGSGLANLLIIEYSSREIARTIDSENLKPKIDRHKARIPLNTDSIVFKNSNGEIKVHANYLVSRLEGAYLEAAKKEGLSLEEIDAALWVIGSQVCFKNDFHRCYDHCPLSRTLCKANTTINSATGYFEITSSSGERIDSRKRVGQQHLDFVHGEFSH